MGQGGKAGTAPGFAQPRRGVIQTLGGHRGDLAGAETCGQNQTDARGGRSGQVNLLLCRHRFYRKRLSVRLRASQDRLQLAEVLLLPVAPDRDLRMAGQFTFAAPPGGDLHEQAETLVAQLGHRLAVEIGAGVDVHFLG